ncbi:hypothetical protein KI387_010355 [Taxus chinensis]|uniref:Nodulin-like domain-containing protein n=1 Tax=Taxus chinensis TaxID=29808 RepID=A0AA38FKY5_TAXCH|nr:hypothetical protein KI387_010355 [Taxus chinensis]
MDESTSSGTVAMKRWICFIAAVWLQSINGTNFVFSNYSSDLKNVLGINQIKLNSLAVASDLGKIMGWVSGMVCMILPTWAVLTIAVSLGIVGYGVQWLMLTHIIHPLAYWQVYILCFLGGNSICWLNTVSFRAAIENFPSNRGIASGLTTSYSGLSAVIYAGLSSILSKGHSSSYLLLNCIVPTIVSTISGFLLHVFQSKKANEEDKSDKRNMIIFTGIAFATALYSILIEFLPHKNHGPSEGIYMSVLFILMIFPLCIPLKLALSHTSTTKVTKFFSTPKASPQICMIQDNQQKSRAEQNSYIHGTSEISFNSNEETQQCSRSLDIEPERQQFVSKKSVPALGKEHGILELFSSIDFWLYYFVYICGGTVGLVYINNLGQILQSLGYTKTPILVSLVSSFGFFGRIASGFPDYIQQLRVMKHWRALPRPAWIGFWMVPMTVSFLTLALLNPRDKSVLYLSTAIVGSSTGAITTLAIPISSELFGLERFAVNHNILITNIGFGSLIFGEIAGVIYGESDQGRHVCMGKQCYEKTFMLWACVCSFGIILCIILSLRTRDLYQSIHAHRQNHN